MTTEIKEINVPKLLNEIITGKRLSNPICYMDFCSQDYEDGKIQYHGRILFEVRSDVVPLTADNFKFLCTGSKGLGVSGKRLHYAGCPMHRIIPNFCTQGGDITKGDGTGGEHIWQKENMRTAFDDENFTLKHEKYCLSMANSGKNKNSSQFFIFHGDNNFLDGKHVVFGKIIHNTELADFLNSMGMGYDGETAKHVYIARSGVLTKAQAAAYYEQLNQQKIDFIAEHAREL